jgi:hypothetical protein
MPLLEVCLLTWLLLPAILANEDRRAERRWPSETAQKSRLASAGKVKPFVGAVDTLHALNRSLSSCSFQREIIMIPSTEDNIDAAAQTMWMLL